METTKSAIGIFNCFAKWLSFGILSVLVNLFITFDLCLAKVADNVFVQKEAVTNSPVGGTTGSSAGVSGSGQLLVSLDAAWDKRSTYSASVALALLRAAARSDDFSTLAKAAKLAAYFGNFAAFPASRLSERHEVFGVGVQCAEKARRMQPSRVEGHYWYAANLAALDAVQGRLAVLLNAAVVQDALNEAVRIDPSYHFGGPYRMRGRLVFKMPFWYLNISSKQAALDLKKAVELYPDYRPNALFFADLLIENQNQAAAKKLLESAKNLTNGLTVNETQLLDKIQADLVAKIR